MKQLEKRYCLRRPDTQMATGERVPQYLTGVGYAAPGQPVPYWESDIREAKLWKTPRSAFQAQAKYGGVVRLLRVDENERPVQEVGTLIHHAEEDDEDWPVRKKDRFNKEKRPRGRF